MKKAIYLTLFFEIMFVLSCTKEEKDEIPNLRQAMSVSEFFTYIHLAGTKCGENLRHEGETVFVKGYVTSIPNFILVDSVYIEQDGDGINYTLTETPNLTSEYGTGFGISVIPNSIYTPSSEELQKLYQIESGKFTLAIVKAKVMGIELPEGDSCRKSHGLKFEKIYFPPDTLSK